ncbi:MAG: hypothetical protein R3320_05265 [Nitriliruptorales bacterium]|nr:hypothetical protein [Nitriliruptorales bacterium]
MTRFRIVLSGLLVSTVVLLAGCSGDGSVSEDPTEPSRDARIALIRAARNAVEEPVAALGRTAASLRTAVDELRADPPRPPDERLAATSSIRQEHIPALDEALQQATGIELTGESADVAAAREAYERLLDAVGSLRRSAVGDLDRVDRAARIDEELDELTRGWDEPGSRRQQLEAFDALATEAEELAAEIAAEEPVAACMETFERRAEAASTVAERTRELRDLIARYRGNEFDQLRSEYRQDPYGVGAALTELDAEDHPCWLADAPFAEAGRSFDDALQALEDALNPADLRG